MHSTQWNARVYLLYFLWFNLIPHPQEIWYKCENFKTYYFKVTNNSGTTDIWKTSSEYFMGGFNEIKKMQKTNVKIKNLLKSFEKMPDEVFFTSPWPNLFVRLLLNIVVFILETLLGFQALLPYSTLIIITPLQYVILRPYKIISCDPLYYEGSRIPEN